MDRPRPDLWAARVPGQVFVLEQHVHGISDGPGIVVSALIPDFDYFNARGGRTLPFLHPDETPNLAPGLITALSRALEDEVTAHAVLGYIVGVVSHPDYTRTFAYELTTPGIRVPFTTDPALWDQAVRLGNQVIWLQTYGVAFSNPERPQADVRLPDGDPRQPLCTKPITSMPESIAYDPERCILAMGGGEFSPVRHEVMEYTVGGRNIFKSWFDYRKKEPGGKKLSQLDRKYPEKWDPDWTTEAIDLLTILTRLVELEPSQADMLERVLASELISMGELAALGTRWPVNKQDHKPRFGYNSLRPLDSSTSKELW